MQTFGWHGGDLRYKFPLSAIVDKYFARERKFVTKERGMFPLILAATAWAHQVQYRIDEI